MIYLSVIYALADRECLQNCKQRGSSEPSAAATGADFEFGVKSN